MNRTALLAVIALAAPAAADPPAPIGTQLADFTLPDPAGQPWTLAERARDAKASVVVFLNTGCPVSNAYAPVLARLHKRYTDRGVVFVGVTSHPTDTPEKIAAHAREYGLGFPVLKDDGTALADKLAVERVPTAFILDAGRMVRYKGRIDDQYSPGVFRPKATSRELVDALEAVLDGREVKVPFAEPAGCKLTRERKPVAAGEPVTYHRHVSRIIQAKCQECHRPGEAAPFALMTYKQARGWADMIGEVVADGRMPPWHADAPRGHFKNDRRLSEDQKQALLAWIEQGCPEGDPADAPPPKTYTAGWRLTREPDLVLRMDRPIEVPAQYLFGLAGMPYQYVRVGDEFAEDTWVQEVEIRPDYRAAIHHVIAYVVPKGTRVSEFKEDFGKYMLAAYVPGDEPTVFPEGYAKKIPKGARLLFELHYTPNGRAGTDQSTIGLVLAKKPPTFVSTTDAIFNERFVIPAGAENHQVTAVKRFDKPVMLVAMTPHMHLRGKAFKFELVTRGPDGTEQTETLLNVPKYDFNWQVAYALSVPKTIPAGAEIRCTAYFDNSARNPVNPDPTKRVRWGEQTWEEMMIGFVEYLEKRE